MPENLKVLFLASEVYPFAKTGGLADVAGALPKVIQAMGVDVRIVMPKYKQVDDAKFGLQTGYDLAFKVGERDEAVVVKTAKLAESIPVYFIQKDEYFGRDNLYGTPQGDYPDNLKRFSCYCVAALELIKRIDWKPDVVHLNDWQTGLVPVYLKEKLADDPFYKDIATVYTIHNLAYQGSFPKYEILDAGLDWSVFIPDKIEFYDKINLMKAGLIYSDKINTVSRRYSEEIQTEEFGCGLQNVLIHRQKDLHGILNGIDYGEWNPKTDKDISCRYGPDTVKDKKKNKKDLLKEFKLPEKLNNKEVPLFGIVSRLADQKGFDILSKALEKMVKMQLQLVVLGTGEQKYHDLFNALKEKYKKKVGVAIGFNNAIAKKIYAGSDFFMMPSRYEPCGLGQMIALRYGTIPLVRETGGLADTIVDYTGDKKRGNGFSFSEYTPDALVDAVKRSVKAFGNAREWTPLVVKGMKQDFSWKASAKKYADLYNVARKSG